MDFDGDLDSSATSLLSKTTVELKSKALSDDHAALTSKELVVHFEREPMTQLHPSNMQRMNDSSADMDFDGDLDSSATLVVDQPVV